jgi:hypothetical protein
MQQAQSHPMGREGASMIGQGGMMGGGMMGRGMMGGGDIGPPIMLRMMFALMDSDSDGTISLTEFSGGSRADFQGNGQQQGWTAYSRGDASISARDQEIGPTTIGRAVDQKVPFRKSWPQKAHSSDARTEVEAIDG